MLHQPYSEKKSCEFKLSNFLEKNVAAAQILLTAMSTSAHAVLGVQFSYTRRVGNQSFSQT